MHTVAIVGSGFSGIAMAIRLRQANIDFVVLEAAESIGGTWRDNTYPGAACDIPSHLYSLSFAPKADWSHIYARQPEIRAYLEHCVDQFGLRDQIVLGAAVDAAVWDEDNRFWMLTTADGTQRSARFVVFGTGALRDPRTPDIPGRHGFAGVQMHSARWDSAADLTGRVGVVGTGASAIQIVPELTKCAEQLTVFQRTPPWVRPRVDRAYSEGEKSAFATVPGLLRLSRLKTWATHEVKYPLFFGRLHRLSRYVEPLLARSIHEQAGELAESLIPTYRVGCKRVLSSNDWYPSLVQPHVRVEGRGITRVLPEGLQLDDGEVVELDALIWCTGFEVGDPLGRLDVTGMQGRDLRSTWGERPRAYLGITVPDFPNAFLLLGPNTALGHSSVVTMIESQVQYVLQAIRWAGAEGIVHARPEALTDFLEEVDRRHSQRVWLSGCDSWYLNASGENFTIWPGSTWSYFRRTRRFDPNAYIPRT